MAFAHGYHTDSLGKPGHSRSERRTSDILIQTSFIREEMPDAITSATPKVGEFVWKWKPKEALKPRKYSYYIEANKNFDKNENHNYGWYRGQPSVLWRGSIQVGNQISKSEAKIIGHGHVAGEDGTINPDLSTLTTALRLIKKVEAVYHP